MADVTQTGQVATMISQGLLLVFFVGYALRKLYTFYLIKKVERAAPAFARSDSCGSFHQPQEERIPHDTAQAGEPVASLEVSELRPTGEMASGEAKTSFTHGEDKNLGASAPVSGLSLGQVLDKTSVEKKNL